MREPFKGAPAFPLCLLSAARKVAKCSDVREEEAERLIMLRESYTFKLV